MTMSFSEEVKREIHILKKELNKIIKENKSSHLESDTETYSNFISSVAKLSGKREGLELSTSIYKKLNINS